MESHDGGRDQTEPPFRGSGHLALDSIGQKVVCGTKGGYWRKKRIKGRNGEKIDGDRESDNGER